MSRSKFYFLLGDVIIIGEGLQNLGLSRRSGTLSRDASLSCHTCCDTGPRFFLSYPKDRPIQSPLTTHKCVWRINSNPDPHRSSQIDPMSLILLATPNLTGLFDFINIHYIAFCHLPGPCNAFDLFC
jgi:hypothetical protein